MTFYFAAFLITAAVALFVAAPLTEGFLRRKRSANLGLIPLQHDRELALQGLRELEFDREMDKLDESDYASLKANLENHALAAMRGLEQLAPASRPTLVRLASNRSCSSMQLDSRAFSFCSQCCSRAGVGYRFCPDCGTALVNAARDRAQA